MTIFIADDRGKFEIEHFVLDDGEATIMINHTASNPTTIHMAIDAEEARKLAAVLIDFANQEGTPT